MAYQPTELEQQARNLQLRALHLIEAAREALEEAEEKLREEERKHSPHVSPGNQRVIVVCTEAASDLDDVWEKIVGEPRITALPSKSSETRRIFLGENFSGTNS